MHLIGVVKVKSQCVLVPGHLLKALLHYSQEKMLWFILKLVSVLFLNQTVDLKNPMKFVSKFS